MCSLTERISMILLTRGIRDWVFLDPEEVRSLYQGPPPLDRLMQKLNPNISHLIMLANFSNHHYLIVVSRDHSYVSIYDSLNTGRHFVCDERFVRQTRAVLEKIFPSIYFNFQFFFSSMAPRAADEGIMLLVYMIGLFNSRISNHLYRVEATLCGNLAISYWRQLLAKMCCRGPGGNMIAPLNPFDAELLKALI